MGKKRVIYELNNDENVDHVVVNHHHHHHHQHHHRHHSHHRDQKKKIKPEAKLLHTLNAHFKKLAKIRSRNTISPIIKNATITSPEEHKKDYHHHHRHTSSCMGAMHASQSTSTTVSSLNYESNNDVHRDRFMDFDSNDIYHNDVHVHVHGHGGDHDHQGDMGVFKSGQDCCWVFLESEHNEDLFDGDCVFAPDFNANHNSEEDGPGYGSYLPDPITNLDDEGKHLPNMELSSQEDMINEFFKAPAPNKLYCVAAVCAVMVVLAGELPATSAANCNYMELRVCEGALSSPGTPSAACCSKVKEQQSCFCGYLRNPILRRYVTPATARRVAAQCQVSLPNC